MPPKKQQKNSQAKTVKKTGGPDTRVFGFAALGLLAIVLYYYAASFIFIQDDSFITYRYVKNFTDGNGLVFNIGEKVEGYTCFLWVMLLAGVKQLGFNYISASQTLGIISSLLTLLFTFLISVRIFPKDRGTLYNFAFSIIAVIMLASNGSFAYWTVSGMETGLFGMLVTLGIFLYLKELRQPDLQIPWSSAVLLLASLTRPEGNIIFAVTVLHKVIIVLRAPKGETGSAFRMLWSKRNLTWAAIYIIPAIIYMIWRYSYYGYLFPNTFYAKTGSSLEYFKTGGEYLWGFLQAYGGYGVLAAVTLLTLRDKKRFNEYLYLLMVFYVFCIYIVFVGGDVLRPNRFFVPLMPVFFILVQEGLNQIADMLDKSREALMGATVVLLAVLGLSYYTYKNEFETIKQYSVLENGLVEKMKLTATWLKNKQTQAGRPLVVGATTIGAISYYSEVTLIDMLGLTDKEVAHNPKPIPEISSKDVGWRERNYNVEYVLSRKPDYILFSTSLKPSAYAERGLFTSDEFIKYYYPFVMTMKEYAFNDIIYKRRTDEEASLRPQLPPNPNYQKSFVNLLNQAMNTQKDKNKLQEAIELYNKSIQAGPSGWGLPYQMMGELYIQTKNTEKAKENFEKAIEFDDQNILSHYYMYNISRQTGDTAAAMMHIEKLKKYAPDMLNQ